MYIEGHVHRLNDGDANSVASLGFQLIQESDWRRFGSLKPERAPVYRATA